MIDALKQAVVSSEAIVSISPQDDFRELTQSSEVRWAVRGGGAVYVAGAPTFTGLPQFEIVGQGSALLLGDRSQFHSTRFRIDGRNCLIYVGKYCRIKGAIIKVTGDDCCVIIGDRTTLESGTILCGNKSVNVIIGDHCMLSNDIVLRTDDGHGIFDRSSRELINETRSVVLEPHVWVGNGARVNKGTRIGTGSVLGGASIASGHIEPYCIYAGVPARKVRENIVWSRSFEYDHIPEIYR